MCIRRNPSNADLASIREMCQRYWDSLPDVPDAVYHGMTDYPLGAHTVPGPTATEGE